jgi:DNA-directed RNA polymerase I and III subunit RPAC1
MSKSKKTTKTAAAAAASATGMPDHLEEIRTKVFVRSTHLDHTNAAEDPDAFRALDFDNSFSLDDFKQNFKITIQEKSAEKLVFDMVGASAPIANALRRILISDVPTMAIEKIIMFQNTSLIHDEVLAHRIGLIPIAADPHMFKYLSESNGEPNEENTTVFTLEILCTKNPRALPSAPPSVQFNNGTVYSSALKWVPQGSQAETFKDAPIRPVHDDIILAKLRPGQSIEAELHVIKGVGRDHAKWSPAATAFYRQLPDISFSEPFYGAEAQALKALCPMNVFDIEDLGSGPQAVAARPRDCTLCRECIRDPEREKRIKLRRVRDHYIFSIETAGQLAPETMFRDALIELKKKLGVVYADLTANEQAPAAE